MFFDFLNVVVFMLLMSLRWDKASSLLLGSVLVVLGCPVVVNGAIKLVDVV